MAKILSINYAHTDKTHGCTCDRCGQWITNIWTFKFDDNSTINFGMDCFDKVCKNSNLTEYGERIMKKNLNKIARIEKLIEKQKKETAETCEEYQRWQTQENFIWYGRPFEEYQKWKIEKFYQYDINKCKKELEKFKNVNFQR